MDSTLPVFTRTPRQGAMMTATGHDLAMALRAAYWAMHRQADAQLLQHGVTADQFVLLSLLSERRAVTQQELVRRASSDANTVRAMLVRLEAQGLIARKAHPTDRRARSVAITAKGRRANARLRASARSFWRKLVAAAGPAELDNVVQGLRQIAEAMSPAVMVPEP